MVGKRRGEVTVLRVERADDRGHVVRCGQALCTNQRVTVRRDTPVSIASMSCVKLRRRCAS
jgi:hypothetical protein